MSHTAQTTYYGLPIYEDKAGNQPTYLGDWNETMRTIDNSLNAVAAQSSGVVTTANQALSAAQQAQQTANAANTVANAAQQTASGLSDDVETAQQTAEAANTAAGTAQSTAESANSTAQQASTTASNALSQAQTAASTAGTAQSMAQTAQDNASTALNKINMIQKIGIVTMSYQNTNGNTFVDIPASSLKSWLDVTDTAGKTLVVYPCNGDFAANSALPVQNAAINASSWDTRIWFEEAQSSPFKLNLLIGYTNS